MTRRRAYRISAWANAGAVAMLVVVMIGAMLQGRHAIVLLDLAFIAINTWILRNNLRGLRAMRTPIPPTNVQIVTDDGRIEAVQCVYRHFDGNVHRWGVITPDWFTYDYATTHTITIRCAELPPWTVIEATVESGVGHEPPAGQGGV